MSTDYGEKEREFIASLRDDTGRDLEGWMAEIAASKMAGRNDIIDWLRHQGFPFAKASWLERIHHNGGRLIYADAAAPRATAAVSASNPSQGLAEIGAEVAPHGRRVRPASIFTIPHPAASGSTFAPDVANALAAAKGLRPLCELVLRDIGQTVPDAAFGVNGPIVTIASPKIFAALLPGPKKLRIYANFGPFGAGHVKAADPVNKGPAPFGQMFVLDDARRVDETFRSLIRAAAANNGADSN